MSRLFWSAVIAFCSLVVMVGVLIAPWGSGWLALALWCWISGGVCALLGLIFLISDLLHVREGRR